MRPERMTVPDLLTTLGDIFESGRDLFWHLVDAAPDAHHFVPEWPSGITAWESFLLILALGALKVYRGTVLKRRSLWIDRFGWSIITFDWAFGAVFLLSAFFRLYPDTTHPYLSRALLFILGAFTLWQAYEVARAEHVRVTSSLGGLPNGHDHDLDTPPSPERRTHYRRAEDRQLRGLE